MAFRILGIDPAAVKHALDDALSTLDYKRTNPYLKFDSQDIDIARLIYHNMNTGNSNNSVLAKIKMIAENAGFKELLFIGNDEAVTRIKC